MDEAVKVTNETILCMITFRHSDNKNSLMICGFITSSLLALACFGFFFFGITFQLFKLLCLLRITDEGSVPEIRIWSILLIKSDLKWCIHLSRSLFLNLILKYQFQNSVGKAINRSQTVLDNNCDAVVYIRRGQRQERTVW